MSLEQLVKDLAEQNKKLVARLEEKSKEMPKMEKMLDELADRNAYLSSRLDAFEVSSPDSSPEASPAPTPRRSPRRRSPRRKTPVAPTPTRRSPHKRNKNRKRNTPEASDSSEKEEGGEPVRRRLSAEHSTPKRNAKPSIIQNVRKTVGEILHLNLDDKITSGYYLDSKRFFKLGLFEDDTMAMVDYLHDSAEIDTGTMSKLQIFKLAVDVAKKRERYTPKAKKSIKYKKKSHAKKKSPYAGKNGQIKLNARAVYQAIVASKNLRRLSNVSPAVVSASAAAASVSAAAALASAAAAADPETATDADVDALFQTSDEDVSALEKYNKDCQKKRALAKAELAKVKAAEAELATAKAAKKAELAKAKAAKKVELAKAKAAKKAELAKAKAAKKAELSKKQGTKQNKKTARKRTLVSRNKADCLFKIGGAVCGFWANDDEDSNDHGDGEWYEGVVVSINYTKRTVHIKYKDNDEDDAVPWDLARILDG